MTEGCSDKNASRMCKPGAGEDAANTSRRGFLLGTAALAATMLAPGVTLYAMSGEAEAAGPTPPVSSKVRWGLLIDASKCQDGCNDCVDACSATYGWKSTGHPETDPQWIRKLSVKDPKTGAHFSLPMMCQHCANPPCVDVCPTGASFKRADGIVLVDRHICIGCRYCMMACPYKARSFVHETVTDQTAGRPARQGHGRGLHPMRPPHRQGRNPPLRRGVQGRGPRGGSVRRPQRSFERNRQARCHLPHGAHPGGFGLRYRGLLPEYLKEGALLEGFRWRWQDADRVMKEGHAPHPSPLPMGEGRRSARDRRVPSPMGRGTG